MIVKADKWLYCWSDPDSSRGYCPTNRTNSEDKAGAVFWISSGYNREKLLFSLYLQLVGLGRPLITYTAENK
jgi:hypothetical protein